MSYNQKHLTKEAVFWSTIFGGILFGFSGIGFFIYSALTFSALSEGLGDELAVLAWCLTAFLFLVALLMIPVYRTGIKYMSEGFEEEEED